MKYPHFREMLTKNINEADILLGSASYDLSCSCGSGTSELLSDYVNYQAIFHAMMQIFIYYQMLKFMIIVMFHQKMVLPAFTKN